MAHVVILIERAWSSSCKVACHSAVRCGLPQRDMKSLRVQGLSPLLLMKSHGKASHTALRGGKPLLPIPRVYENEDHDSERRSRSPGKNAIMPAAFPHN